MWTGVYRQKDGVFPAKHPLPCTLYNAKDCTQYGTAPQLEAFRLRKYWASAYPQGDGLCILGLNNQTPQQVVSDIEEVFNWEVTNKERNVESTQCTTKDSHSETSGVTGPPQKHPILECQSTE